MRLMHQLNITLLLLLLLLLVYQYSESRVNVVWQTKRALCQLSVLTKPGLSRADKVLAETLRQLCGEDRQQALFHWVDLGQFKLEDVFGLIVLCPMMCLN